MINQKRSMDELNISVITISISISIYLSIFNIYIYIYILYTQLLIVFYSVLFDLDV